MQEKKKRKKYTFVGEVDGVEVERSINQTYVKKTLLFDFYKGRKRWIKAFDYNTGRLEYITFVYDD